MTQSLRSQYRDLLRLRAELRALRTPARGGVWDEPLGEPLVTPDGHIVATVGEARTCVAKLPLSSASLTAIDLLRQAARRKRFRKPARDAVVVALFGASAAGE